MSETYRISGDSPDKADAEVTVRPDAAVPDGEDPLTWLKMCLQGYDYLLADPQPGLFTWQEARDRGRRRIIAACLALIREEARP
jgi:hypothetical protein